MGLNIECNNRNKTTGGFVSLTLFASVGAAVAFTAVTAGFS